VEYLEKKKPNQYISKMAKAKRGGKIFVDYLRNQRSATAIGTFSTRSRIHAPVSVPIEWDELTNRRRESTFTIKNVPVRLKNIKQDPWADFWKIKQQLPLEHLK
jgi:bifunctional non-homologous end joining protein LigD